MKVNKNLTREVIGKVQSNHFHRGHPTPLRCVNFRSVVVRPRRSRSAAAYSRQTFLWTICRSVRAYVRASVGLSSALWKNGRSDPDAVWHHRSDGSRDEAGSGVWGSVHGKWYLWDEFGARHCNQWGLYSVRLRQHRDAALFPNYFGQTCFSYCADSQTRAHIQAGQE